MQPEDTNRTSIPLKVMISTVIILGILIIAAGTATYLVPAGTFKEVTRDNRTQKVYQRVEQTPVPVWKILLAPILALTGKNGPKIIVLLLFILFIGGSFSVMLTCGIIPAIMGKLVKRLAHQKTLLLMISILVFSLMGSCLGILEEMIPMIVIFVPLALSLGWDSLSGLAMVLLSLGFGFSAAMFNPFTLGTAQRLADVPLFSGLMLRLPLFMVTTTMVVFYLLRYVRKVEHDPTVSVTYKTDLAIKRVMAPETIAGKINNLRAIVVFIIFCFALIVGVVVGGTIVKPLQDLAFPLIMLIFLIMGMGSGLISGAGAKTVLRYFAKGLADFSPAIIIILMAFAVGYLIEIGNVMDTILYKIAQTTRGMGKYPAALSLYFCQMLINFFVPSGSGQAALTIPLLAPLGDLIGISRQTVVLAFHMGDGFSNLIWPTNPLLLIALGLAKVSYRDWFKWVLPIQMALMAVCIVFLLLAIKINYS
jgi:uncharacterized ion transporter superfamily protein YfcC